MLVRFTQSMFDDTPMSDGTHTTVCPTGDYRDVKVFHCECQFGAGSVFAAHTVFKAFCQFGARCQFGHHCTFAKSSTFGPSCVIGRFAVFGRACVVGYTKGASTLITGCIIGSYSRFDVGCRLSPGTSVGAQSKFADRCRLDGVKLGPRCSAPAKQDSVVPAALPAKTPKAAALTKFTAADLALIPPVPSGRRMCPTGDYRAVLSIPHVSGFGAGSKFAANTVFHARCHFGVGCTFGPGCVFHHGSFFTGGCKFGQRCEFGRACRFGYVRGHDLAKTPGSVFSSYCTFAENCWLSSGSVVGRQATFAPECSVEAGASLGARTRFLESVEQDY